MSDTINIQAIIKLVEEQESSRQDVIEALKNCSAGQWTSNGYFQFVSSENANQPNSEWQHDECLVIEQKDKGDIVIDVLKDGRIGGIEFIDLIDK
jgi:hypothetical protein